jgi:hypothetical protein
METTGYGGEPRESALLIQILGNSGRPSRLEVITAAMLQFAESVTGQ